MKRLRLRYSPLHAAALYAGLYALLSIVWIHYSTGLASQFATSVEEMQRFEFYKGIGYNLFMALLFFFFSFSVFRGMSKSAMDLMRTHQKLVETERISVSGLIASSISHDISNVLTVLRLNTEQIRGMRDLPPEALPSFIRLDRCISRLADLTARMREAGRNALKGEPLLFDFNDAIAEVLNLLRVHTEVRNCTVQYEENGPIPILSYPVLIHQLLMNLLLNAAQATAGEGKILIRARRTAGAVELEVHDNGMGIPPAIRERVFDAFYTTKSSGSGLGLLSVKSSVEMHQGEVTIGDSELGGALFKVRLPDMKVPQLRNQISVTKPSESLNKGTSSHEVLGHP